MEDDLSLRLMASAPFPGSVPTHNFELQLMEVLRTQCLPPHQIFRGFRVRPVDLERLDHAVVAVTQGLLDKLDRSELEGVIAHELSHIGNRDILLATVVTVLVGRSFISIPL